MSLCAHVPGSAQLGFQIERHVRAATAGYVKNLKVVCDGTRVILTGHTNSYYTKQVATRVALALSGEFLLENSILVNDTLA